MKKGTDENFDSAHVERLIDITPSSILFQDCHGDRLRGHKYHGFNCRVLKCPAQRYPHVRDQSFQRRLNQGLPVPVFISHS